MSWLVVIDETSRPVEPSRLTREDEVLVILIGVGLRQTTYLREELLYDLPCDGRCDTHLPIDFHEERVNLRSNTVFSVMKSGFDRVWSVT